MNKKYPNTLVLLLHYLAEYKGIVLYQLDLSDILPEDVISFLDYLEKKRKNSPSTRNVRLAAIHAFFRFVSEQFPEKLELSQRILTIPFKRTSTVSIDYLDYEEIVAILSCIEDNTLDALRDYLLLFFMFNTGARVQEVVNLTVKDLQLVSPFQVRLQGKGRKERICPLWPQTAQLLREYCLKRKITLQSDASIFINHRGYPITRFGIRYIMKKRCQNAQIKVPTLIKKSLHPHSMRHSTAIHLLKCGVDIVTISHWLGHVNLNTTNRYVTIDLEMKRKAIEMAESPITTNSNDWETDKTIIEWLESL